MPAACSATSAIREYPHSVMSLPARRTSACPMGMRKSPPPSGISPRVPYSRICSTNSTGSFNSRQLRNSPMTSRGVAGVTTVSPGTAAYHPSKDCECVAPTDAPAPVTVRIISGMENCPPDIYRILAAWFTI